MCYLGNGKSTREYNRYHDGVGAGREQVYSIYCHISLNIEQILIKFTPLVYCMNILQIVKFDLICITFAMVTDKSLLSVNGFPLKQIPKNLLALQ